MILLALLACAEPITFDTAAPIEYPETECSIEMKVSPTITVNTDGTVEWVECFDTVSSQPTIVYDYSGCCPAPWEYLWFDGGYVYCVIW